MKMVLATILLFCWLFLVFPMISSAQENVDYFGLEENSPTASVSNNQFDWWWLLPLALLPVALYVVSKGVNVDDSYHNRRSQVAYHQIRRNKKSLGR